MNRTKNWTLLVAASVVWCSEGNALSPEPDLQSARMRESIRALGQNALYGGALRQISIAGDIPVSVERAYVGGSGAFDLVADKQEKLSDVIERFCRSTNGMYTSTIINGFPIIKPAHADTEPVTSALDVNISITLHESSTWDALRQFMRELNASPELPRYVTLEIGYIYRGIPPPSDLTEAESLTMSASDMTAREVLCRIMKESPIPEVQYSLFNAGHSLILSFPDEGHFWLNNTMETNVAIAWFEEIRDFAKECKEIFASSRK